MDVACINGAHIAYRYRPGLGRTIVFANSLGSDQSIWDAVIAALPRGYGILTYDLRGHGQSSGEADSIEGLADDVSQLIDLLGLRDVLFCGVSIGGMIGQVMAANRGDVLRAAVLCNTASRVGTIERWDARIAAVQADGVAGIAEEIAQTWFGAEYATREDRVALHANMISQTRDSGYLAACRVLRSADLSATAATIKIPVFCVAGSEDRSVLAEAVEGLAQVIPGASLTTLDGIGHLPCLEAPAELAQVIATFDPRPSDAMTAGMAMRRAVLGTAHVDQAQAATTAMDAGFQALITSGAWGQVWANPALSARERSMLTLALLAATGNFGEISMHVKATARTGATPGDIAEAFQHVAIYAGVPKANHALKLAKQALAEMSEDG